MCFIKRPKKAVKEVLSRDLDKYSENDKTPFYLSRYLKFFKIEQMGIYYWGI